MILYCSQQLQHPLSIRIIIMYGICFSILGLSHPFYNCVGYVQSLSVHPFIKWESALLLYLLLVLTSHQVKSLLMLLPFLLLAKSRHSSYHQQWRDNRSSYTRSVCRWWLIWILQSTVLHCSAHELNSFPFEDEQHPPCRPLQDELLHCFHRYIVNKLTNKLLHRFHLLPRWQC